MSALVPRRSNFSMHQVRVQLTSVFCFARRSLNSPVERIRASRMGCGDEELRKPSRPAHRLARDIHLGARDVDKERAIGSVESCRVGHRDPALDREHGRTCRCPLQSARGKVADAPELDERIQHLEVNPSQLFELPDRRRLLIALPLTPSSERTLSDQRHRSDQGRADGRKHKLKPGHAPMMTQAPA